MLLNNRENGILYELLKSNAPCSYDYLCNHFNATAKTIRNDIRKINDAFKNDNIQVLLKHGVGFYVDGPIDIKNNMLSNYSYRFSDEYETVVNDVLNNVSIYYLLANGNVKIKDLGDILAVNQKSVSLLLKGIRYSLASYNLKLVSKPYYGMTLEGNEINIRYLLDDSSRIIITPTINGLFKDDRELFKFSQDNIDEAISAWAKFITVNKIQMSEGEIRSLVAMFLISKNRINNGYFVKFTEEEKKIIRENCNFNLIKDFMISDLNIKKIPNYENEIYFFALFFLISCDFSSDTNYLRIKNSYKQKAKELTIGLVKYLENYYIINKKDEQVFIENLFPNILNIYMRSLFNVIEHSPNNMSKNAMRRSPLASTIATLAMTYIEGSLNQKVGETVRVQLAIGIYSIIKTKTNGTRKINIAIFTPLDKKAGESVRNRILDYYEHMVDKVDILSFYEIYQSNLENYDVLLHFEDTMPLGLSTDILHFKISYFFDKNDIDNFYEKIFIPNRQYRNCFAKTFLNDINDAYEGFNSLDDVIKYTNELCQNDDNLLKQVYNSVNSFKICKNILNLVLFTSDKNKEVNKFFRLKKPIFYRDIKINRVYIFIIKVDENIEYLKTAEKILRNLVDFSQTSDDVIFKEIPLDFYEYFINDKEIPLI